MNSFNSRLRKAIRKHKSNLCVGIDISPEGLGVDPGDLPALVRHSYKVVDATRDLAVAYKPNLAFFERFGSKGFSWLEDLVQRIGEDKMIIGDAKRGDIGNTARQYAKSLFTYFNFDAVTLNPYMGEDAILPFAEYAEKGTFILCRTSNPGALEIQGVGQDNPLYLRVAEMALRLNTSNNLGLVVGATAPEEMQQIRNTAFELPFLIPGVGTQGGDLEKGIRVGNTGGGALISVSRSIIFAGDKSEKDIRHAAENYVKEMRALL